MIARDAGGFVRLADDIDASIQAFLDYSRAKGLSDHTIRFYSERLTALARFLENTGRDCTPAHLTPEAIRGFMAHTRESSSAATANHNLNVLRNFLGFLVREGFLDENPALRVDRMRQPTPLIDAFSIQQVDALLSTCDKSFYGLRDRAIILTLLDTGMRVSELATLRLEDIRVTEGVFLVWGKGARQREVPFGSGVRRAITAYLTRRGEIPGQECVFVTHYGEAITRRAVRWMLRRRAKKAGVSGPRISPHTFRHSFALSWLKNGGDAFSLMRILGHTSLAMTRKYVLLANEDIKEMHSRFSPVDRLITDRTGPRKRIK